MKLHFIEDIDLTITQILQGKWRTFNAGFRKQQRSLFRPKTSDVVFHVVRAPLFGNYKKCSMVTGLPILTESTAFCKKNK